MRTKTLTQTPLRNLSTNLFRSLVLVAILMLGISMNSNAAKYKIHITQIHTDRDFATASFNHLDLFITLTDQATPLALPQGGDQYKTLDANHRDWKPVNIINASTDQVTLYVWDHLSAKSVILFNKHLNLADLAGKGAQEFKVAEMTVKYMIEKA